MSRIFSNNVNKKEVELKIEDIAVVREYHDMFLEDLSGLPPDREIEFLIELIPGIVPISKVSYRITPTEMKELKVQL